MAKNLKLKIKNAQLASALKITTKKTTKKAAKTTTKKAKEVEKEEPKKPKVRIVKPKEEKVSEEKPKVRIAKTEQEKPPVVTEEVKPVEPKAEEKKEEVKEEKVVLGPVFTKDKKEVETSVRTEKKPVKKTKSQPKATEAPKKKEEKKSSFKDFKNFKSQRKKSEQRTFDSRDKQGLRTGDDDVWRKRRGFKPKKRQVSEEEIIRPKTLEVRLPITVKALASEMKRKATEVISKLFMQGIVMTLNDLIDDETLVQLVGHELDCEITIDTTEQQLINVTEETIDQEIEKTDPELLKSRPVVLTFMGHVDHGKTSLIDSIRKSSLAKGEAGAITQHIGAFKVKTENSEVTILDTPGHEAFTEMRMRGARVTDIIILVVAGDEGIKDQTIEAIEHAKTAKVPILVAINKCDKPNFETDKVYRQLSDLELLPEAWGGSTITVNCSAVTGEGISELLEMAALQAEILELKANPETRARGTILESEMHKGFGAVATCLVQNGTLKIGDAMVFGTEWGRIKTMHDEHKTPLKEAPPATPVKITGLSGLAEAGCEFIIVGSEKEAKKTAEARREEEKRTSLQKRKKGVEHLMTEQKEVKILPVMIKADVQGSLEALKNSLMKIKSDKVELNIFHESIGEISESDVELASASNALILGFHTRVEAHAEPLIKEKKTNVVLHDIIYHAVDDIKKHMTDLLDPIAEEKDQGTAEVKTVFKSSHLGLIAGCQVIDGIITRNHYARLIRNNEEVWKGKIASLKRDKDDAKEVSKGMECGILLENNKKDIEAGDVIEAYEVTYKKQTL